MTLSLEVERSEAELRSVAAEKRAIEARVALLHPDHVEPDMLDEQTRRILEWADTGLARPIRLAVVTHSHSDRIGGVAALGEYVVLRRHKAS